MRFPICCTEQSAPTLKSFVQAWHSWRNTPDPSRAREISQQKRPRQIRLSKQIWDLKQRQGRGQWIARWIDGSAEQPADKKDDPSELGLRIEHLLTVTNTQRSLVLQVQQKLWELLSVRGSNIKCTAMQSMMAATTSCSVFDLWVRKERRKRRQFERSGERGGSSNRMASTGSACSAGKTWIQAGY